MVDSSMSPWPQLTHTARNAEKCACRTSGDAFCRYAILACGVLEARAPRRRVALQLFSYFFDRLTGKQRPTHFLLFPLWILDSKLLRNLRILRSKLIAVRVLISPLYATLILVSLMYIRYTGCPRSILHMSGRLLPGFRKNRYRGTRELVT